MQGHGKGNMGSKRLGFKLAVDDSRVIIPYFYMLH